MKIAVHKNHLRGQILYIIANFDFTPEFYLQIFSVKFALTFHSLYKKKICTGIAINVKSPIMLVDRVS